MVTNIKSNYTSPAGKEFTLVAGRLAGINPGSKILDIGCGYGDGSINLALEHRCKITAVDVSLENIDFARQHSIDAGVSHLIECNVGDILESDYSSNPFDLVLAEGGIFSFIGRSKGLDLANKWLLPSGWIAFSDFILLSDNTPSEVLSIFENDTYKYETEDSYRKLVEEAGFEIRMMALVPKSGWDNYYAHMARRLDDEKGFFADRKIKIAFHREIDVFYRLEGFRYVGYLVCFARKKNEIS